MLILLTGAKVEQGGHQIDRHFFLENRLKYYVKFFELLWQVTSRRKIIDE